jgi:hypothetical protein
VLLDRLLQLIYAERATCCCLELDHLAWSNTGATAAAAARRAAATIKPLQLLRQYCPGALRPGSAVAPETVHAAAGCMRCRCLPVLHCAGPLPACIHFTHQPSPLHKVLHL